MPLNNVELAKKIKNEGNKYAVLNQYAKAEQCYDEAIIYDPLVKEYWFNKGLACQMQEQYHKALDAYSQAIKLDNNYQKAIDNQNFSRAKILQLQGNYQQALQLLWKCPKTPKVEAATIDCLIQVKAEIFFGRVDLKLTQEGEIKLLELGDARLSNLYGLQQIYGKDGMQLLEENLSILGMPMLFALDPGIMTLDRFSKALEFCNKNKITPRDDFDLTKISGYSGIYCGQHIDKKLYKNILKVGDNCFASQIVDDFLLTYQALDNDCEGFFLPTKVLPKRYNKEIANIIRNDLPSQIYRIKVPDLPVSSGVWYVQAQDLDLALKCLLEPNKQIATELFYSYMKKLPKVLPDLIELFVKWRDSICPSFMAEAYVSSKTVQLERQSYDPTMRVAFLAIRDSGVLSFKSIGGYWQLPISSSESTDLRMKCNTSLPHDQLKYVQVDPKQLQEVYDKLNIVIPKIFAKLFKFNLISYQQRFATGDDELQLRYNHYLKLRLANSLGSNCYTNLALDLLKDIDDKYGKLDKIYHERGMVYLNDGRYESAIAQFSEAIKLSGNFASYFRRGLSYYALGDLNKAFQDLKQACKIKDPVYQTAYNKVKFELESHSTVKHSLNTNLSYSIDLHGLSANKAKKKVASAFSGAKDNKFGELKVITGLGNHVNKDGTRGILRKAFPGWVKKHNQDINTMKTDLGAYDITFNSSTNKVTNFFNALELEFSELNLDDNEYQQFLLMLEKKQEELPYFKFILGNIYLGGIRVLQDIAKGRALLESLSKNQYIDASLALGIIFSRNDFPAKDYKLARQWLEQAASREHPKALFELGKLYWMGHGVIKDDKKAIDYFSQAAQMDLGSTFEKIKPFLCNPSNFLQIASSNCSAAAYNLGEIYCGINHGPNINCSDYVGKNFELAYKYYLLAAKKNDVKAQCALGRQYFYGWGIEKNEGQGFFWFEKAAISGDSIAQYYVGLCYDNGLGIESDLNKALHWYEKSAEQGDLDAKMQLAYGNILGRYSKQDIPLGNKQLEQLIEQDHANSLFLLGLCLLGLINIEGKQIPKDLAKGFSYIARAAELEKLEAQTLLARLYFCGQHCEKDLDKASYWLRRAVTFKDPEALFLLSVQIEMQSGFATTESLEFLRMAAELGWTKAESILGISYLDGVEGALGEKILLPDSKQAIKWLEKAAKSDCDVAQFNLGILYFSRDQELSLAKDYSKAVEYFKLAAKQGNSDANTGLGFCYMEGKGVSKDLEKAKYYFSLASATGDEAAIQNLGYLLQQDDNGNKKRLAKKSIKQLTLEAEQGNPDSQYELSSRYITGMALDKEHFGEGMYWLHRCVCQNHPGGIYILKKLLMQNQNDFLFKEIKKGLSYEYMLRQDVATYPSILGFEELDCDINLVKDDPVLQRNLGIKYRFGQEAMPPNYEKAIQCFEKAASCNDPDSLYNLAAMYQAGQGVKHDPNKAIYWFKRAAEVGNSDAQFVLGMLYKAGEHVTQNQATAAKWLHMAAEQGDPEAQFYLGSMYRDAEGVKQSELEAIRWLEKSANQGDNRAQSDLGVIYQTSSKAIQNHSKAVKWYQKSAEQGNSNAQYNLGCMYQSGIGVAKDTSKAIYWFKQAAQQGQMGAQCSLGASYLVGNGVSQDSTKALELLQQAANQGYSEAMHNLGLMYQTGQGVLQDYHKAIEWYKKAAEQGNTNSQNNLGFMYQNGEGVPKNYSESIKWYQKAACQGNVAAQENLTAICEDSDYAIQRKKILKKPRPTF